MHEIRYSDFHVIKTTAWIPTKFCTPIKTTKYASRVVQKLAKQINMVDGRHLEKWKIATQQPFDQF